MVKRSENIVRYASGMTAVACSVYFALIAGADDLAILFASLFILSICITDTLYAKIPNWANLALILAGLGYNFYVAGAAGVFLSALGLLVGLLLFILPYLMGGMGAGDVKALAALGALLGPGQIWQVFLYVALIGGVMAMLHYVLAHNVIEKIRAAVTALRTFIYTGDIHCLMPPQKGERLRFPYATAIAFGFFAFVQWGALI